MKTDVNFDLDAFEDEIENAPTAGFGPRMTYGEMFINDIQIMAWKGARGEPRTPNPRPFANGDRANKEKGEYLQITLEIDVQAINPRARQEGWTWERKVDVKQSGSNAKTDWDEIVLPSFVSVIGKDWSAKLKKGIWVEVEEPDTVVLGKDGKPKTWTTKPADGSEPVTRTNTTVRVTRVFKNKSECLAAFTERYSSSTSNGSNGEEEVTPSARKLSKKVPDKIAKDVAGILSAYDDNEEDENLVDILTNNAPYNLYDFDALISAARK